jgi:hypothetical protein
LFDILAHEAISKLRHFNSQDMSNMLLDYAKEGVSKSDSSLFEAVGDSILALDHLVDFWPQQLSNIILAHATAGEKHPRLFMH